MDHPSLIEVGIVFALNETINEGHAYVPKKILKQRAIELLEISPDLIAAALEHRAQDDASCACYLLIRQPFEKFKQGFH